ncbi:MAG: hypothetical protein HY890_02800 [Deltaproteobacteria bacterium]|nr:hypothetical protein [Deltaproteobacteria bacterium]
MKKGILSLIVIAVFLPVVFAALSFGGEGDPAEVLREGCARCHPGVYEAINGYKYTHPDQFECVWCHLKSPPGGKEMDVHVDAYSRDNIMLLYLKENRPYRLRVKAIDREGGRAFSRTIEFIPGTLEEMAPDDGLPPVISNLRVEEVRSGIFYSAVIAWETNKPALSSIEYGRSADYGDSLKGHNHYATDHRMVIDRLIPRSDYFVRAVAEDVFGRSLASEPLKFRIKKPFLNSAAPVDVPAGTKPEVEDIGVSKVRGRPAFRWRTNMAARAIIFMEETRAPDAGGEPHYPGLGDRVEMGLKFCQKCHSDGIHSAGGGHPTGRVLWEKAKNAEGLPLGPGGMILCTTCHAPHGNGNEFILRKKALEICNACHYRE